MNLLRSCSFTAAAVWCLWVTDGSAAANPVVIDNDSVWTDVDGHEIKAQGGCIIKVGSVYEWFGPEFGGAGDYRFTAINRYSSTDLKTWLKRTPALTPTTPGSPLRAGHWVGRPWVMWNPTTRLYVMAFEWGGGGGIRNQYAFCTSPSIDGPWTYQSSKLIQQLPDATNQRYNLGDLGVYSEGTTAWLLYTFDKPEPNYSQAILKLDTDFMTPLPPTAGNYVEFSGGGWPTGVQEAAAIFKRGDTYYYFTSLCQGWRSSVTRYRTATNVAGPWSANTIVPTNPASNVSFNTQHDFVLKVTGTDGDAYVYCGDRWSNFTGNGVGRNAWFPLSFDANGVPMINAPTLAVDGGDWTIDAAARPPVMGNLLRNPGFEQGLTSWDGLSGVEVATSAPEVHAGTLSLKAWQRIAYTGTARNVVTDCAAGTYSASVWSRAGGSFPGRFLRVYVNGALARELTLPVDTTWKLYRTSDFAVPEGAEIRFELLLRADAGSWTQFDDADLHRN